MDYFTMAKQTTKQWVNTDNVNNNKITINTSK